MKKRTNVKSKLFLLALMVFISSCGGASEEERRKELIESRPYTLKVPGTYEQEPMPLILTLHGLTSDGEEQATRTGLLEDADTRGFFLAYPDGSLLLPGIRGWNASCCDETFDVDDVEYLNAVIDDIQTKYEIDPDRIYLYGVSNGAFMSLRLICENAERFAGAFAHAGSFLNGEESECTPSAKVPLLYSHGTQDEVVPFEGGMIELGIQSPSVMAAETFVEFFKDINACSDNSEDMTFDGDQDVEGDETLSKAYQSCEAPVEFWKLEGSAHIPLITTVFREAVLDFLLSQSKS